MSNDVLPSSNSTNGNLEERISACRASMSPKQKRLAHFILTHQYFMSFASASQAGEKIGASAATVVRFAQMLGYSGFSEMQAAIRADLPSYGKAIERIQERLESPPPSDNNPQKVFYTDIQNIKQTANSIDEAKIEQVVEELIKAKRIFVVGSGLSAAPAQFLAHSLKIIGFDAHACLDGGLSLAADTALFEEGCLMIAIGLWRYARSTIQAAVNAQRYGTRVIAITDNSLCSLATIADCAFEVATRGVAHSLSVTAVFSLVNVLIAALSDRLPEQILRSLRRVDAAYLDGNLLIVE
jgi:DNA-binding MurR/RpiR family transcriptional regulator